MLMQFSDAHVWLPTINVRFISCMLFFENGLSMLHYVKLI